MCVIGCGHERVLCEDGADTDDEGFGGDVEELAGVMVLGEEIFTAEDAEFSRKRRKQECEGELTEYGFACC